MQWTLKDSWKVFLNTFICNYHRLFGNLKYPSKILPRINFKGKINITDINNELHCIIVRRSDKNKEETFNELGMLRPGTLDIKRVPGMSLNLLGAFFLPEYSFFRTSGKGSDSWGEGEVVYLSDHLKEYHFVDNTTLIFFDVNKLHNITIPYNQSTQDSEAKKFASIFNKKAEGDKYKFDGKVQIDHSPTKLNYWHVELNLTGEINQDQKLAGIKNKWHSSLAKSALESLLTPYAYSELNGIEEIPQHHYLLK